jgi:small-conductance mechanosensitive channel
MVQLILLGGSRKTYPTAEFLKQSPDNISTNFRIKATFGLDYAHQAIITHEIPEKLRDLLLERLAEAGHGDDIIKIKVEFKEAAASSLDLEVLADFSGRAAKDYESLKRTIQKIAVDACNDHGWVIPFTQVTVHHAQEPGPGTPQ